MDDRPASLMPALAGALTVGAGLVHATAAASHRDQLVLVVLFGIAAAVQVVVGMWAAIRPERLPLKLMVGVNLVVAAAWTLSRTTGIQGIEALAEQQSIGLQDLLATALELTAAAVAVLALVAGGAARRIGYSPLWVLALVPALVGMGAPHDHSESHAEGTEHAAGDTHAPAGEAHEGGSTGHTVSRLAADPMFAGADTSHASEAELQAAKSLITVTRESVSRRFPDEASLRAAGYRSIGDGAPFTRFEHFVNASYLTDGRELDVEHLESVVVEGDGPSARVVSAMYILDEGKTMADVPAVGGPLTAWHDHQNLCWELSSYRLAGILVNGRCFPGGTLRATPPMLHVWLADNECGPFAGIEGHPAGPCSAAHGH